jgi:hypothetical protein
MESRSSQPSDLARVVFHELQRRYDESSEGDAACPSLEVLTNLFEMMFFASMSTEEGESIRFHVVYLDPDIPDAHLEAMPPADRWTTVRFGESIPATIPNLVKLAMASDPRTSSLALYHDADGRLFVWGLVDQGNRYYDFITHAAWPSGYERPGLFQASIIGVGRLSADIGYERIAELWMDTLRSIPHDVLADGPIRDSLQPGIRSFVDAVHGGLPEGIYERRPDRDTSLTGAWLSSLSGLLLRVRSLRHGGAVLITPDTSRRGLDIKYGIEYPRLRSALREAALLRIREAHARDQIAEEYLERGAEEIPVGLYREEVICSHQWEKHQNELDGTIGFISLLTRVDGLVLMDNNLDVHGFGVMIGSGEDPPEVYIAGDSRATQSELRGLDPNHFGSRHRSMMRYCAHNPGSVGFVFSQDGDVRAMTEVRGRVVMWEPIRLIRLQYLTR